MKPKPRMSSTFTAQGNPRHEDIESKITKDIITTSSLGFTREIDLTLAWKGVKNPIVQLEYEQTESQI